MKKNILFFILNKFSDWESTYVSTFISVLGQDKYEIKTVSITKEPIKTIGGFTVLPDYDIKSVPYEFEALILVGGMSWRTEEAKLVKPLIEHAIRNKKILGAICDASVFIGAMGILNNVKHTSNDINDLKAFALESYTNEENYLMVPAVNDNNIITANGTATLEFAKEVLLALKDIPKETILGWYDFYKKGCYEVAMPQL